MLANLCKSLTSDAIKLRLLISKILRTDLASTKEPFLGGFWALTPSIWSNIVKILTRNSILANKYTVSKTFEGFQYLYWTDPKLAPLVQL